MTFSTGRRGLGAVVVAFAAALILPTTVAAHAELQTATPKDGATVAGSPPGISGTYSEAMTTSGSSLVLLGPDGKQVATGGVDPANDRRMTIDPVPDLVPGMYTVKSTTKSAADGDIDRKEWTFTVVPAPTPTPTLAPSATAAPSVPAALASASPTPNASPAPSGAVDGTSSGGGDVVLPIIAALAIVGVGGALLLGRRGRTG